jgi:hypothetical protein
MSRTLWPGLSDASISLRAVRSADVNQDEEAGGTAALCIRVV